MWIALLFGLSFLCLMILIRHSQRKYAEIDLKYGKAYKANIIELLSASPDIPREKTVISFHPKNAICVGRKVYELSQINSITTGSSLESIINEGDPFKIDENTLSQFIKNPRSDEGTLFVSISLKGQDMNVMIYLKAKADVANELMRSWQKSMIT